MLHLRLVLHLTLLLHLAVIHAAAILLGEIKASERTKLAKQAADRKNNECKMFKGVLFRPHLHYVMFKKRAAVFYRV